MVAAIRPPTSMARKPTTANGRTVRRQGQSCAWCVPTVAVAVGLLIRIGQTVESHLRVGYCAAGTHFRGHPDGFHDLLASCARAQRRRGMAFDAVGALRDMRHGHGNELFGAGIERAVLEHVAAELLPGLVDFRRVCLARVVAAGRHDDPPAGRYACVDAYNDTGVSESAQPSAGCASVCACGSQPARTELSDTDSELAAIATAANSGSTKPAMASSSRMPLISR